MLYGFCSKISYAFQQCKNFENQLRFDKVTNGVKVGTFLRYSVDCIERLDCFTCRVFVVNVMYYVCVQ